MITLKKLSPSDVISDAPSFFNSIFASLEEHINELEKVIDNKTKIINLTDQNVSSQNGSMIINALSIVGKTGILISLSPSGKSELFSVDSNGEVICTKITANSSKVPSEFKMVNIGFAEVTQNLKVQGMLDISSNVGLAQNYSIVKIVNSNIGSSASTPIKVNDKQIVYLDYRNDGNPLTGSQDVKIDTTNLQNGQVLMFVLLKGNSAGTAKLNNGDNNAEIFCYPNPAVSSQSDLFKKLSSTILPEFKVENTTGKKVAWIKVQWTEVGGGNYKFVILESQNMANIE